MTALKRSQIRNIEEVMAYPKGRGYVLDFSDRTFAEFFEDEFGINIDDEKYYHQGTSKRWRLLTFIDLENDHLVTKVLRTLWERRESLIRRKIALINEGEEELLKETFLNTLQDIESSSTTIDTKALDRHDTSRTLDELIKDIERDINENKPEAAMDHLHTYCINKITHLLKIRGIECDKDEPLHSRFGKYRKELVKEIRLTDFTDRALKMAISLFESYNTIRNDHSFAHDNPILTHSEARYVFETISALLIFLRSIESVRYDP